MEMMEQLRSLSRTDALAAMDVIWQRLLDSDEEPPSPDWHFEELARREEQIENGEAKFTPWEEAKVQLRAKVQRDSN